MNKRIIRVIIYEGNEELVDAYERHSLQHTQKSFGMPRHFNEPSPDKSKQIFITGVTLEEENGLFQAIEKHNIEVLKQLHVLITSEKVKDLVTPVLNDIVK